MPSFLRNLMVIVLSFFCLALGELSRESSVAKFIRFPLSFEAQISVSADDGDFVKARSTAISLAVKDAVKQAIDYLLGDFEKELNPNILSEVISDSWQYVKSYNFLYVEDNLYDMSEEVGLEVSLYPDALKSNLRSLGVLSESKNQDSMLILIKESVLSGSENTSFWDYAPIAENFLIQRLSSAGIPVIRRNTLRGLVAEQTILAAVKGDISAALEVGTQVGVDIVILGNATTSELKSFGEENEDTVQANISVKTISVQKGAVIAAKSDFASAQSDDLLDAELQAYDKASIRLSAFLLKSIKQKDKKSTSQENLGSSGSPHSPIPFTDL